MFTPSALYNYNCHLCIYRFTMVTSELDTHLRKSTPCYSISVAIRVIDINPCMKDKKYQKVQLRSFEK